MSIPFTQYMRPDGRQVPVSVERPSDIETLAHSFIDAGGWFEVEHLSTGHASLTACWVVDGEPQDIAIRVVENGPAVPSAVDELVREAAAYMGDIE
jgi:hypothetical protein